MASIGEIKGTLTLSTEEFDKALKRARDGMEQTGRTSRQTAEDIEMIQNASFAVGAAVVTAIGATVKTAADFEAQMSRVKAISGATDEEFQKLKDSAVDLGAKTSKSASEIAIAFEDMAAMGFNANQIMEAMPGIIAAAEASGSDLALTSQVVAAALNGFQMEASDASRVADVLAKTANISAASVDDMGYAFKYASPIANSLGISMEELAAATGIMVDSGLEGSQAGTTLRMALLRLADPTEEGAEALEKLGVKTQDADKNFRDLTEMLPEFEKGLDGMTDAQKVAALSTIFGTEAASGMLTVIEGGVGQFNEFTDALENSEGASKEAAAVMKDNLKGAVEEFTGALESVGIEIGEDFLPFLTDIVKKGAEVVGSLDEMDLSTVKSGLAFAGTASAIALTISTLGKLGIAVKGLMVSMGPAGWLIAGVSLLGGAVAGLVTKNKELDEAILDSLKSRVEEQKSLGGSIKRYEELENKSKLSTKELGRFLDINSEIQKTVDPKVIEDLRREQEELRIKSGLSNEELEEMVGLNQDLIEKVPEATAKITEQGNRILDNVDALKEYSDAQLEKLYADLDIERIKTETKYKDLLEDEQELIKNSKTLEEDLVGLKGEKYTAQQKLTKEQEALNSMMADTSSWSQKEIDDQKIKVKLAQEEVDKLQKNLEKKAEGIQKNQEELSATRDKIAKLEDVRYEMAQIVLAQNGLNAKKGEELTTIDQQLSKLESARQKLVENTSAADKNRAEYKEALAEIDKQIGALQSVKNKVLEITATAEDMNYELGRDIRKNISTYQTEYLTQVRRAPLPTGPQEQRHRGGIVGSNQLIQRLSQFPNHNEVDTRLLRNEMVLTEAQQANLMRMIDAGFTGNQQQASSPSSVVVNQTNKITVEGNIDSDIYDDIMRRQTQEYEMKLGMAGVKKR